MPMAIINFRAKTNVKEKAAKLFEQMGLDMSSALNMFLTKVVDTKSIPFRVTTINGYTPEFEKALLGEIKNGRKHKKFNSIQDMMKYLES